MPYRDRADQLACARRHYARNAAVYIRRKEDRKITIRKWLTELKTGKSCADCGNTYPPKAMDFHHERGEKEFEIGAAVHRGRSKESILREIEKCVLLCAVCHRLRD